MSITRGRIDRTIRYGDDSFLRLPFTTTDADGNEIPHELTQYDAIRMHAQLRKGHDAEPTQAWELGDGLKIVGADDNVLRIDLRYDQHRALAEGHKYQYDIKFRQGADWTTLLVGTITASESVTQR